MLHETSELQWNLACGQYNGQACLNGILEKDPGAEEHAFDPEILECLKTSIQETEDYNVDEIEPFERPEEDDEKEEEN